MKKGSERTEGGGREEKGETERERGGKGGAARET